MPVSFVVSHGVCIVRYLQAEKKPPHGQAHLVFADTKANPEKPKELALPSTPN